MNILEPVTALLNDLHTVSGMRVSLHDADFNEIAAAPENCAAFCLMLQRHPAARTKCLASDRYAFERVDDTGTVYLYRCHCGLWEAVCPLYHSGVPVGYLMIGQALDSAPGTDAETASAAAPYLASPKDASPLLALLPRYTKEEMRAFTHIMTVCAEHLAPLAFHCPPTADLPEAVSRFLRRNFDKRITISALCDAFHCSKSTLLKEFREKTGVTIGDYLTACRMAAARDQLLSTKEPIGAIALRCGYPDPGYFGKVFSARFGCSPSDYRNQTRKNGEQNPTGGVKPV